MRTLSVLRCPDDGRTMARLEVDDAGAVSLWVVGGKRGDLARGREWEDAKGRASWLGVVDPTTREQVPWWLPTANQPLSEEPCRVPLPTAQQVADVPWLPEAVFAAPIRVVCPRCHRVDGARLSVSERDGWSAVLASLS